MRAIGDGALSWRSLTVGDLPLLVEWFAEPQVARWWNHEATAEAVARDFGPSARGQEPGEDLVVLLEGRPIGLLPNVASWRALEKARLQRIAEGEMAPDNPIDEPLHFIYRARRP